MSFWKRLFGKEDTKKQAANPKNVTNVPASSEVRFKNDQDTSPTDAASDPTQKEQRRVRVFISSTFKDMKEDRDELMTQTWPKLRAMCSERQVELVEVDLRWGISEEQSTRKETLKLCLDEIHACRPFFIGLLGERYGWTPGDDAFTKDLMQEQEWLGDYRGKSVTELEILHGALNNPEMAGRAFFYFRDPVYAKKRGADFLSGSPDDAEKQDVLKGIIRAACAAKGIPLHENYPDPKTLADLILKDLEAAINIQFPKDDIPDSLKREEQSHEAFAETRRRTYIGRTDYFAVLDRHAGADGGPLVVLGESGGGKSALLSNWVKHWRDAHEGDFIFQHYIGGTTDSADNLRLMIRLMDEVKRWTGDPDELPKDKDDIKRNFSVWLAKARLSAQKKGVRFIVVLDALNQLDDVDHSRSLGWLPSQPFSGSLRLVVSTLPGEAKIEMEKRSWELLCVQPLTSKERAQMVNDYLKRFGKKLDQSRVKRLSDAQAAENPLYLKILLDELRVTGTFEGIDDRLSDYLSAPDISALLKKVLARYERDYERDRPGLVVETLGLIRAARRGLTENELLTLLKPADMPQLPPAVWSPLRAALDESLVDRGGVLNFAHDFLRAAVEEAFVPDSAIMKKLRTRLADYFESEPATTRGCDELPWLLWQMGERGRLYGCLLDMVRFLKIMNRDQEELMGYWVWLGEERVMGKAYLSSFDAWSRNPYLENALLAYGANELAFFLEKAALYAEAEPLCRRALTIWEKALGPDHSHVATSLVILASLYRKQGQYADAEPLVKRALAIWENAFGPDHPDVATSLGHLAGLYQAWGQYADAEPLFKRALTIWEKALGPDHPDVATSLGNLALLYQDQGQYAEAEPLFKRALAIREKSLSPDHPDVAKGLGNLARLYLSRGQYADAEPLYKRALTILEKALGPDHPDVAISLNNLASLYKDQGQYADAKLLFKRALSIKEKAFSLDHPDVATSLNNLASLYQDQGQYAAAEPLFKRALTIWENALGPDHSHVATSLNNLAGPYLARGQYADAEPLIERALSILEKSLGPDHPDVAVILHSLSVVYLGQGEYAKAEPLLRRHLEIFLKFAGASGYPHIKQQAAINGYTSLLKAMGRSPEQVIEKLNEIGEPYGGQFGKKRFTGQQRNETETTPINRDGGKTMRTEDAMGNPKITSAKLEMSKRVARLGPGGKPVDIATEDGHVLVEFKCDGAFLVAATAFIHFLNQGQDGTTDFRITLRQERSHSGVPQKKEAECTLKEVPVRAGKEHRIGIKIKYNNALAWIDGGSSSGFGSFGGMRGGPSFQPQTETIVAVEGVGGFREEFSFETVSSEPEFDGFKVQPAD